MGARHALFWPFAAPRTVEIPESPRGWYGADRKTQQGRQRFRRAVVLRLRRRDQDNDRDGWLPRTIRENRTFFLLRRRAQTQATTSTGAPTVTQATYWPIVSRPRAEWVPQRHVSTAAVMRTSHASRRDRGSSGECVGASGRPRKTSGSDPAFRERSARSFLGFEHLFRGRREAIDLRKQCLEFLLAQMLEQ